MNSLPFPKTAAFVLYSAQLRELHALMSAGQDEALAADALRDSMDLPFRQLTREQVTWLEGLSEDLYTIAGDETEPAPPTAEPSAEEKRSAEMLREAHQNGDWMTVLRLLRTLGSLFSTDALAYVRYSAYRALGEPETALLFIVRAAHLAPSNLNYQALALRQYADAGDLATAWSLGKRYLGNPESESVLVIAAANVATEWIDATNADSSELEPVIEALNRVLPLGINGVHGLRSVLVQGHVLLGMCYRRLGRTDAAISILNEGMKLDPQNDGIYVARGLSALPHDAPQAVEDFKKAIQLNTRLALPYLFMAPYLLEKGQLEEAEQCAVRALEFAKEPTLQADALLWIAVCAAERGNIQAAGGLFAQAQGLDPLNAQIAINRTEFDRFAAEFETSRTPLAKRHGRWQQASPAVFARRAERSAKLIAA